ALRIVRCPPRLVKTWLGPWFGGGRCGSFRAARDSRIGGQQQMILDNLSLEGKIALITGAGRGLGRAMALRMANCGADIVAASRTISQVNGPDKCGRLLGRRRLMAMTDVAVSAPVSSWI